MITVHHVTFKSVYDPTSFKDWILILGGHKKVFDGMTSFQMYFNPIFLQILLKPSLSLGGKEPQYMVICRFKCDMVDCDHEYIGESARNFEERFKEHLRTPFPIHNHLNTSGHSVTIDNFSIFGREDQNLMRLIKEALYIRVNNPSLNKNIGVTLWFYYATAPGTLGYTRHLLGLVSWVRE